jgi:hypothetical protein
MRINVPQVRRDGKHVHHGGTDPIKAEIRADVLCVRARMTVEVL